MNLIAKLAALVPVVVLAACAGRTPTTEVSHPLGAWDRLNDHTIRVADGIARYREVQGAAMPASLRDLSLTIGLDGQSCFTENLKDHWFHPYAYAPINAAAGTFTLASAGPDGQFGTRDDLSAQRGPGDPRMRTYGYTLHAGE